MSEIYSHACRLLARREHSVAELRTKLQAKWPGDDQVGPLVDRLAEEGLVCDRRFASALVRSRIAKLQGPRKVRAELLKRSVSGSDIEAAMRDAGPVWTELATMWLLRQGVVVDDHEARAKYYRRLLSRGFTHDQAMDAMNQRAGV
jgi:regulatory protein